MGRVYADIPGYKKFDSDLNAAASYLRRLAADAAGKAETAKKQAESDALKTISRMLEGAAAEAVKARRVLWDAVV